MSNTCRCSVFLLDCLGQELVATVFDGAVQAKVSNSSLYMYSTSSKACAGMCKLYYCVHLTTSQLSEYLWAKELQDLLQKQVMCVPMTCTYIYMYIGDGYELYTC